MATVSPDSLDWALTHITQRGDTDIFPLPFEYSAIAEDWNDIRSFLSSQDLNSWAVRPLRRCLAPKYGLGFRVATQLDPLDSLLVAALVYELGAQFEAARVPTSELRVHSYRFAPEKSGQLYDPSFNFESFRKTSLELARLAPHGFVVLTDIADFFPRLYLHPLENAMTDAASDPGRAGAIARLLKGWNMGVSYGVPVGPAVIRLLAELTINDIDQALLSEGYEFCRFSDDYRLFVPDERTAHEALAFLANLLLNNHGLTLQESKTEIVQSQRFVTRFQRTERDQERHALQESFEDLVEQLGIAGGYEDIEYEDLDDDQQALVDSLNLWHILEREVNAARPLDIAMVRFVLSRIRQLGLKDEDDLLLGNVRRLYPVFPDVVRAVFAQRGLMEADLVVLGGRLLDLFDHATVGHLEYHRDWMLMPFAHESEWNHRDRLVQLYNDVTDVFTRRALTMGLGRAGAWHWFKPRKQGAMQLPPWERRAFLFSASCLPGDEAAHWYRSLSPSLDSLERSVVKYARAYPVPTHSRP